MSFSSLGLSDILCQPLERLGYAFPTPVQVKAIPVALTGADVIARAQTGTGKTAAFGLPLLDRLIRGGTRRTSGAPRGLILVPTRELAMQVERALITYGAPVKARVAAIVGGVGMGPQTIALRRGVDIVVATPGRLLDHMQRRTIDISALEILTLDEADRMLDMGFLPSIRRILQATPRGRQTLLFSATVSPEVRRLAADFMRDPLYVDVCGAERIAPSVEHSVHPVGDGEKGEALAGVLRNQDSTQVLVFCKTRRRSDRVGERLTRGGFSAAVIHGSKSQNARNRALRDFKSGRVQVLVATDIAARGLDIPHLPLVINYDLPLVADDFIHRIGRTGRAGRAGRAVSFVSPGEREPLAAIQRLMRASLKTNRPEGLTPSAAGGGQ